MKQLLQLPIVEILQIGLPGLCFLLSLLGYSLLRGEQKMERPREIMLKSIRGFNWTSLIVGVLVATAAFVQSYFVRATLLPVQDPTGDYIVDQCVFEVDFRDWTPVEPDKIDAASSPVRITRSENLRKNTIENKNYLIPFYTTGAKIDCNPLQFPTRPTFQSVQTPGENPMRKDYEFELPIGGQVKGYKTSLMTEFVFWNGFRDTKHEWWAASIKYPTRQIQVTFHFPASKPCKKISVWRKDGISAEVELRDVPAIISQDGAKVVWIGQDFPGDCRVFFKFDW